MSKQRRPSNRIGSTGETLFELHAKDHGLLPTKAAEDVGLDYFCQLDLEHTSNRASLISGGVVGFAARATTSEDGRIRLSRDDVAFLLQMEIPVGVALVHDRGPRRDVYHRMLDEAFVHELVAFLDGNGSTISLTPGQCRRATDFRDDVLRAMRSGEVERLRIAVAKKRLSDKIALGNVEVHRDHDGALTVVSVLHLFDYFEQLSDQARDQLHLATFGAPALRQQRLSEMIVRDDVLAELRALPKPYLLGGFVYNADCELRVDGPAGEATCTMRYARNGRHWGYAHDAGFALTVSMRKKRGGVWVHELGALVDPELDVPIDEHPELLAFLAACLPGASIKEIGDPERRFEVEQWGRLSQVGRFADALKRTFRLPGWRPGLASLRHEADPESFETLQLLAAAVTERDVIPPLAFVLEQDGEPAVLTGERWLVPVVANTQLASATLWLTCAGDIYMSGDVIVGVRTERYLDAELEIRDARAVKATAHPEFVLGPSRPALVLRPDGWDVADPIEGRGPEALRRSRR